MKKNVEIYNDPDPVVVIRNWYFQEELDKIWKELDEISSPYTMQEPSSTGSAVVDNVGLKKGHGIFLDDFYLNNRESSTILNLRKKIFNDNFFDLLTSVDRSFYHFVNSTSDRTLVNYYEQNHFYKKHYDKSIFTCVVPLWREPKKFDGGDFLISDRSFNLKSNDLIIFPGYLLHEVTPIIMHQNFTEWKSGRFSITSFINYRSH